ncbi:MAG: hypothetical protein IJF61_06515 [Clostridia bacterium]|nr:hypothetical protein [Clostridia bacterium]
MVDYVVRQVVERDTSYVKAPSYAEQMEAVLNEQADAGYRLHTILTSDRLSQNISFNGKTQPKTILIFEKVKEKE